MSNFCLMIFLDFFLVFGLSKNVSLVMDKNYSQAMNLHPLKQNQFIDWIFSLVNQQIQNFQSTTPSFTPAATDIASMTEASLVTRNCSHCACGLANKKKRIVGGQETEINQYPWIAMLLYKSRLYCAGSLVNDQYIVTAAHCVYGFKKEVILVRLLDHSRTISSPTKIDRGVRHVDIHPLYSVRSYDNDIAVLNLQHPVKFKELLRPVCMPSPGKSFVGKTGIVIGWGATKEGGVTSNTLQEVNVDIMANSDCKKSQYGSSRITENMLCAGFKMGQKDSCQGDSGGPLHVVTRNEYQLVGIVSWGEGCAKPNFPGVYTRVNRYGTWIKSKTKEACTCYSDASSNTYLK